MSESENCSKCGAPLPRSASSDLCPHCVLSFLNEYGEPDLGSTEESSETLDSLPGYTDLEPLGRGGMSCVYRARHEALDRMVAIKVLAEDLAENPEFRERFLREAKAMARLDHPNIVSVYDFGETPEGQAFFTMELVEGATLRELIREEMSPSQILEIASKVCDALHFAHQSGYVHRDIKPGNILVGKNGVVKVADFGLTKTDDASSSESRLTLTDVSMGTPDYMAPEQVEATGEVDHRADIFSLGVVLYEMFTGALPRGAYAPPSRVRQGLGSGVDRLVERAMQQLPEDRHRDATEVKNDLTSASRSWREKEGEIRSGRSNALRVATLLIVIAAIGAAFLLLNSDRGSAGTSNPFDQRPNEEVAFPLPMPPSLSVPCRLVVWRLDGEPVDGDHFVARYGGVPADLGNLLDFDHKSFLERNSDGPMHSAIPLGLSPEGKLVSFSRQEIVAEANEKVGMRQALRVVSGQFVAAILCEDGTVVPISIDPGNESERAIQDLVLEEVPQWEDMIELAAGRHHLVGISASGEFHYSGLNQFGGKNQRWTVSDELRKGPYTSVGAYEAVTMLVEQREDDSLLKWVPFFGFKDPIPGPSRIFPGYSCYYDTDSETLVSLRLDEKHPANPLAYNGGNIPGLRSFVLAVGYPRHKFEQGIAAARVEDGKWLFWGDTGSFERFDPEHCEERADGCWKVFLASPYGFGLKPIDRLGPEDWTGE